MITIEHIALCNLGGVDVFSATLCPGLNLLETHFVPEISAAISFLLCNRSAPAIPKAWLRKNTRVTARVLFNDTCYFVRAKPCDGHLRLTATDPFGIDATGFFQYTLSHCPEQDALERFDGRDRSLPFQLHHYLDHPTENLPLRTDHIAETKTFRAYLLQYVQTFRPEPVNCRKPYFLTISRRGAFEVRHPHMPGPLFLSETEEKLFLYTCFLNLAEFWSGVETLRDLHHVKKPLLIHDFLERLDEAVDIRGLIGRTLRLERQIILLTPPEASR